MEPQTVEPMTELQAAKAIMMNVTAAEHMSFAQVTERLGIHPGQANIDAMLGQLKDAEMAEIMADWFAGRTLIVRFPKF